MKKLAKFFIILQLIFSCNLHSKNTKKIDYEKISDRIVANFIKNIKKEYNFICSGTGGAMPFNVKSLSIDFISNQKASIESARKFEVELIEKLLKMVNENKKIRPYLNEYPFKPEGIEISISFSETKNKNLADESIVFIHQTRSKLFYYISNDKDDLIDKYEEPYSKAYEIVTGDNKYK